MVISKFGNIGATTEEIYKCPVGFLITVDRISLVNIDAGTVLINLYKVFDKTAIRIIEKDKSISAGATFIITDYIYLREGQSFKLNSNGSLDYDFNLTLTPITNYISMDSSLLQSVLTDLRDKGWTITESPAPGWTVTE